MKPAPGEPAFDFALLQHTADSRSGRNRRALFWLVGLLLLLVASIVTLVLYLQTFEAQEQERQHIADAQWLEQSVAFHFRRLEDDLTAQARRIRESDASASATPDRHGGLLWSEPGIVLAHGWLSAAEIDAPPATLERLRQDSSRHPENAAALATVRDITRGLRRSSYAGPMRRADGSASDVIWLTVPVFERGDFAGSYLAAMSLDAALQGLVPNWFQQDHRVQLMDSQQILSESARHSGQYLAPLSLAGTDLALLVTPLVVHTATVPRTFFVVALLFLLGMLASLVALRRDILKRQRVEALLQAQVALRKAMENSVTIGLRAWDLQGRILYVNQAFSRMVGYAAHELVGRSAPLPYWPQDQHDTIQPIYERMLTNGTLQNGVELQFQHRDGQLIDVLVHEAPLSAVDGEQLGWMSSVLDISARKRAERMAARQQERLEASGRLVAIGEVASTLAHELNQPLGALNSFANGLLNRLRAGKITLDEVAPVVQRMERLADKSGRIIQRVNAFAQRHEMAWQRVDLVAFMRGALAQRQLQRDAQVSTELADAPVWIDADASLLEHALHNVLANALYWAPKGGRAARVRIRVGVQDHMAGIIVGDSGPGVSSDSQEQIFTAFFSAKEDGTGMGMGLAICRSVVEAHHGQIEVGRDPDLGGARFSLWFPLAGAQIAQNAGTLENTP